MKITRKQLKRMIYAELLSERAAPILAGSESKLRYALVEFIQSYMLTMRMNPGNPDDRNRIRAQINEMITAIIGE